MMTKIEVLNSIIDMTRITGQGVPGFIRVKGLGSIIDELIIEKKITSTTIKFSTLPDDEWFIPVDCYNVWKDKENAALTFVRMYLGIEDLGLGQKPKDILSHVELMERYVEWLKVNEKELIKMVNLKNVAEEFEDITTMTFSKEEIDWVKSRRWFKENEKIAQCLKLSLEHIQENNDDEIISLNKRLLKLYESDSEKYKEKIIEAKKEISDIPKLQRLRLKLNKWLEGQVQNKKIQDIFKF
jgi:hypothetical protein